MNSSATRSVFLPALIFLLSSLSLNAAAADSKSKTTLVDSGSFGIVVNGKRVATETFRVEQGASSHLITSELKLDDPGEKAAQTSVMEISSNGLLKKYTWKETQPGKAQIVVKPQDDQFLSLLVYEDSGAPPKELTHALSPITSIMDDNFFSHMQVLLWKYMAAGCRMGPDGQNQCVWNKQQLPVLNPHQQTSMLISLEYVSVQKFSMKGKAHSYKTFKLKGETAEWVLWLNDENKLMRVVIAADNTEVLRD